MITRSFITIIYLIFSYSLFASPEKFQEATKAYQQNNFQEAINLYETILSNGLFSKEVYYNLGNSYYKNNQLGKAVLYYEKAALLQPSDADIQHNLKIVRQELVDDIEVLPPFFLAQWWKNSSHFLSSAIWSMLAILTMWGAIIGGVFWIVGKQRLHKKRGFLGGIIFGLMSLLFFALGNTRAEAEKNSGFAILMEKELRLRSAPDADSKVILSLHEGTKVAIQDQIGEWYKIRLANGEIGWLPQSEMEKI